MKGMEKQRFKTGILSVLLTSSLLCFLCGQAVYAAECKQDSNVTESVGEHHPEHTENCGYKEAVPETPCTHEHLEDCWRLAEDCIHTHTAECFPGDSGGTLDDDGLEDTADSSDTGNSEPSACTHRCSEETGCITEVLDCTHEHDENCGYRAAVEGIPCGYILEDSGDGPVIANSLLEGGEAEECQEEEKQITETLTILQAKIDALPTVSEYRAMTVREQEAVYELAAVYSDELTALTEEEVAFLDITRIEALFAVINEGISTFASFSNSASDFELYTSNCLKRMKITITPIGSYAKAFGRIAVHNKQTQYSFENRWISTGATAWPDGIPNVIPDVLKQDGLLAWGSGDEFEWTTGDNSITVEFADGIVDLNSSQTYYVYLWTRSSNYGIYVDALICQLKTGDGQILDENGNVLAGIQAEVDYVEENLSGLDPGVEYDISVGDVSYGVSADAEGEIPLSGTTQDGREYDFIGKTIKLTHQGTADGGREMTIAPRPDAPDNQPTIGDLKVSAGEKKLWMASISQAQEYIILPIGTSLTPQLWKNGMRDEGDGVSFSRDALGNELNLDKGYVIYSRFYSTNSSFASLSGPVSDDIYIRRCVVAFAERIVEEVLDAIIVENDTTKEDIQNKIDEAISKTGLTDITATVSELNKTEATTSAEGHISGEVTIVSERERVTTSIDKTIPQMGETKVEVKSDEYIPETDVMVDEEKIKDTVLDQELKNEVEKGGIAVITLEIKNVQDSAPEKDKQAVERKLGNEDKLGMYLDISLLLTVNDATGKTIVDKKKITESAESFTISFTIPDRLIPTDTTVTRSYQIVRVHNNNVEILPTTWDKNTAKLMFTTDKFSTYAIIYKDMMQSGGSGSVSGSGGGSSSGSIRSSQSMTGLTVMNTMVDCSGSAAVTITNKNVNDAVAAAYAEAAKKGVNVKDVAVVIHIAADKTPTQITAYLPKAVQDTMIRNNIRSFDIRSDAVTVGFSLTAIRQMNTQAQADVTITAMRADSSKLTGASKARIGSRSMFHFTAVYGDGKTITNLAPNSVRIAIPYILGEEEKSENVQLFYIDENGEFQGVFSVYNPNLQTVAAITAFQGAYTVGYNPETVNLSQADERWLYLKEYQKELLEQRKLYEKHSNDKQNM